VGRDSPTPGPPALLYGRTTAATQRTISSSTAAWRSRPAHHECPKRPGHGGNAETADQGAN